MKRIALLALVLASLGAHAQTSPFAPQVVPNGGGGYTVLPARIQGVSAAEFGRVWGPSSAFARGISVQDQVRNAPVGTKAANLLSTRHMTAANVARAAARGALGGSVQGILLTAAATGAWCKWSTGSFTCDELQPPSLQPSWCVYDPTKCAFTAGAAAQAWVEAYNATVPATCSGGGKTIDSVGSVVGSNSEQVLFNRLRKGCNGTTAVAGTIGAYKTEGTQACPAVVDFGDPIYSVAGGPPNADGKCPTGRYQPMSDPDLTATRLAPYISEPAGTVREIAEGGTDVTDLTEPQSLSGPGSVPGGTSTTIRNTPNGTPQTITSTTTYNVTYNNTVNNYRYTTTTTTTNETTGEETVTETEPDDAAPPPNPALGELPELYTQKFPDGIAGVWQARAPELQATPIFAFLQTLVPSTGDGGCPAWALPQGNVLGIAVGGDISVPCYVWSAIRLITILSALFLCRRLIFGG